MTNPYAPPQAAVYDVSDRTASLVPADRGTRLGAAILDTLILGVLVYLPFLLGVGLSAAADPYGSGSGFGVAALLGILIGFAGFAVWVYFTVVYVSRNGQSIAKKWMNIKVVRADGSPVSLGRVFWLRNIVNGLLGVIPLYGIIDSLFIFSESRQCLHDKLADTIVVNA